MEKFKYLSIKDVKKLPNTTGIYCFKKNKDFLYIGKAINIKNRVKNHIQQPTFKDNVFVPQTEKIGFIASGSEIEALILEANLIKKYQPQYNQQWKDGKNYYFVAITNEKFPRILITHQLHTTNYKLLTNHIGPFIDSGALRQTLRILRKIFPYRTCNRIPKKACLYKDLALCPAPCEKETNNYKKNIQNIIKILQRQKNSVIKNLQKEMLLASQKQNFEKANEIKSQIFAIENVFSHSHVLWRDEIKGTEFLWGTKELGSLGSLLGIKTKIKRIEGYDISNIQGQEATGSMVVFEDSQPNKNEYRKFKVKITGKPNDTAMLREVISRRLKHKEWALPQVMLIDGGIGQFNVAISCLGADLPKTELKLSGGLSPRVMALAKKNNELFIEGKDKLVLLKDLPQEVSNLILQIRDEAHRFAITYHKTLRKKAFLN